MNLENQNAAKKRKNKLGTRRKGFIIAFLAPTLIAFCVFYLYPIITVFVTSFCKWDYTNITEKRFEVDIEIVGLDRPNLLNDIITVLGQVKVNILNINAGVHDMDANIKLTLSVENAELLQLTIDNLNKIQGVYEIKRVIH